jgi:hypothetical protein
MKTESFENPLSQLLWIMYKLRKAENNYNEFLNYINRKQVKYWQAKADEMLSIIGIDDNTDFKNIQLTIIDHKKK